MNPDCSSCNYSSPVFFSLLNHDRIYGESSNFAKYGNCNSHSRKKRLTNVDSFGETNHWPWHLALWDRSKIFICSASLITSKWAISAGHCINYSYMTWDKYTLSGGHVTKDYFKAKNHETFQESGAKRWDIDYL